MAKKDVERYYLEICEQQKEMLENVKEMEEECQKGMVAPERLKQLKDMTEVFNQNYKRISYIMFLLNQPAKKEKVKKYNNQNKKKIEKLGKENSLGAVLEENKKVIENIKNI